MPSTRTLLAQEIQSRILALDLPGIGDQVYLRQNLRTLANVMFPHVEIRRGLAADAEPGLSFRTDSVDYNTQALIRVRDTLDEQEAVEKIDEWYEAIAEEFRRREMDVAGAWLTRLAPLPPAVFEKENLIGRGGMTIICSVWNLRPTT